MIGGMFLFMHDMKQLLTQGFEIECYGMYQH